MSIYSILSIFIIIIVSSHQHPQEISIDDAPKSLQQLAIQLKSIITSINEENFSELVKQLKPKSDAAIRYLLGGNTRITQDDVDKVVDLINATISALPKDSGLYQRACRIPDELKRHLKVLVLKTFNFDESTTKTTAFYR